LFVRRLGIKKTGLGKAATCFSLLVLGCMSLGYEHDAAERFVPPIPPVDRPIPVIIDSDAKNEME
jgi:hypothetical protein